MKSLQPSTNRFFFQIYEECHKEYHRTKGESSWVVVDRTTLYGATSNSGAAMMQTLRAVAGGVAGFFTPCWFLIIWVLFF